MGKDRKTEKLTENGWRKVEFENLAPGHVFRMFEPNGDRVINTKTGSDKWVVAGWPYEYDEDGTFAVDTEDYIGEVNGAISK